MEPKIKKLLDNNKIKYKIIEHRKVYTAFNEAETQHLDPKSVVKTVFVKFSKPLTSVIEDHHPVTSPGCLVAVPAGKRVDLKKIAKTVNDIKSKADKFLAKINPKAKPQPKITVKLASEKDITKHLKTKIGLLSAFDHMFMPPLLFDKKLEKNKKLVLAAGSYTESVEVATKDFVRIMVAVKGNFTE